MQGDLWGRWTLAQPVTQRERELEPRDKAPPALLWSPPKEGAERGERQEPPFLSSLSILGRPSEHFSCVSVWHACVRTLLVGAGNSAATQPCLYPGLGMTPPSRGTRVPLRRPSGTALEVQWLRCLAPNAVAEWRWSVFEEIPRVRGQGRSPSKTAGGTKSHLE